MHKWGMQFKKEAIHAVTQIKIGSKIDKEIRKLRADADRAGARKPKIIRA